MVLLYVSNVNPEKWAFCHNICDRNVTEHPSLNIVVTVWILALVPEPLTFVLSIPSEMTPRRLASRSLTLNMTCLKAIRNFVLKKVG